MKRKVAITSTIALLLCIAFTPIPNLDLDYSKVVYDKNGQLLSAKIAGDEQWRFPIEGELPEALEKAIVYFEDEYFRSHPGVNPVSMMKAVYVNIKSKRIVRGGSTITMQVMRMYRGNQQRTIRQKMVEMLGAVKLELLYSKKDILKMWASLAPFGGNTVGASTASWRYFDRDLHQLSWAEYATLAVLPNTPSKVHMTKNVSALKAKRDQLLRKLHKNKVLDDTELALALEEDLYFEQKKLPQKSLHFMEFLAERYPAQSIYHTTIDPTLQQQLITTLEEYSGIYQFDGIDNAAAVVVDAQHNEVVAYVGNTRYRGKAMRFVDCVQAPRSYGSLLKPLLYAYAIDKGYFLPHENIKDIPTNVNGFTPKNFDRKFRGVVPMDRMVSQSLNVPAVRILNYVGVESFHHLLKKDLNFTHLHHDPTHHGLSLILGGAEASMWDLARAYKGMIRNQLRQNDAYNEVNCLQSGEQQPHSFAFHPTAVWHTLRAMQSVNRPKEEQHFQKLGGQKVAWKTGTSYGHRDAWAIGTNGRYVVAVWIGNENGDGVYNLTGAKKAAPVLFRMMRYLGYSHKLEEIPVRADQLQACAKSGLLKGHLCTKTTTLKVPHISHQLRHCSQHQIAFSERDNTKDTLYFLNPVENYYHAQFSGEDLSLPVSIQQSSNIAAPLNIVYPERNAVIVVPKKLDKEYSNISLKANTAVDGGTLFWFLNGEFLKKTEPPHQLYVDLKAGQYALLINDEAGNRDEVGFEVVRN